MFTAQLSHFVTVENLKEAAFAVKSKAVGLDKESIWHYRHDEEALRILAEDLLEGRYVPQPFMRIEIEKNETESRPLALASARDKIVQKMLASQLGFYFDAKFSDKSYGYRPGKGTLRAINRCRDFIKRGYRYAYKTDIDNFFESIDQQRLLVLLEREIADKRIVALIGLMLKNGSFKQFDYLEHYEGVHQGDALSPLLSNIYLDQMDKWLEENGIVFVRFADDFLLFFKKPKTHKSVVSKLNSFLSTIGLRLGEDKSYAASFEEGVTFLGCRFQNSHVLIDNERLQKKVSKLYAMAKKRWDIERFVSEVNSFTEALQRYYLKIITPESPQFSHLEHALMDAVSRRIAQGFESKEVRYKKDAKRRLESLMPLTQVSRLEQERFVSQIVDRAKSMARFTDKDDKASASLGRKKQKYARKMAEASTLFVDQFGVSLGVAKNKITLKQKGKVVHTLPKNGCEHIIIQTKAASISSALIKLCAKQGIPIDFIDGRSRHFASLHTYRQSYAKRTLLQLRAREDEARTLGYAKAFIKAKLKNQANYLKYLDKHHKEVLDEVGRIRIIYGKIAAAGSVDELMGLEGSASALYWSALGKIVSDKVMFSERMTQGATDVVNNALNYGYAILYAEVQKALVKAGLALHVSFLHALDDGKPTLVFDLIEEFRTFVVDRTVFSMVNKEEPLSVDEKGLLTQKARRLVAKNVIERLGSFTVYKKESRRLKNVIQSQAYLLAKSIDEEVKYKGFIGRY